MDLETERLLLPRLGFEHVELLAAVYADAEVAMFIGGSSLDADGTRSQLAEIEQVWRSRGYGQSAVVVRSSGQFVGRVGLHPWPEWDEVEIGWVLARHAQGRGYATEAAQCWLQVAFGELGLARVTAVIAPANRRSRLLAERLGFTVARADVTRNGIEVLVYERRATGAIAGRGRVP